jgi:hypothetical protein
VDGVYERYSLDQAVWFFGTRLEGELDSVEGKNSKEIEGERQRILNQWIPRASEAAPEKPARKFADPATRR